LGKNNLPVLDSAKSNIHKSIFNKLKKSTERRKADLMLHDTGELQWYNSAFAKLYLAEDQPPWTSLL